MRIQTSGGTNVNDTKENFKTVIEVLMNHFFPPTALQHQNIYLLQGLFNPWATKIRELIIIIKEMVDYLEDFPQFGYNQRLP